MQQALGLDKSRQTQGFAVLTLGICGNTKLMLPLAEELSKKYPDDTLIQNVFIALGKAFVALGANQPQSAIDAAEPAKPYSLVYPGTYVQGLAYLRLHDANRAINAFRSATQSPGGILITTAPFYAQAQLGLARAYAMAGNKADAKESLRRVLCHLEERRSRSCHSASRQEGIRCPLALSTAKRSWGGPFKPCLVLAGVGSAPRTRRENKSQLTNVPALIDCWHRVFASNSTVL